MRELYLGKLGLILWGGMSDSGYIMLAPFPHLNSYTLRVSSNGAYAVRSAGFYLSSNYGTGAFLRIEQCK